MLWVTPPTPLRYVIYGQFRNYTSPPRTNLHLYKATCLTTLVWQTICLFSSSIVCGKTREKFFQLLYLSISFLSECLCDLSVCVQYPRCSFPAPLHQRYARVWPSTDGQRRAGGFTDLLRSKRLYPSYTCSKTTSILWWSSKTQMTLFPMNKIWSHVWEQTS